MDENKMIGDYQLLMPFSNENAGKSRWAFARKEADPDRIFFLKEFLSPVYPTDTAPMSEAMVAKKRAICEEFEQAKMEVFSKINDASDNNLLRIEEFFRCGSKYYIATEKVDSLRFEEEVCRLSFQEKVLLMKIICHALYGMHSNGLIHGDLKPDNVLCYRGKGGIISARIIDVDDCFSKENPPDDPDEVAGDPIYLAPEFCYFIATGENYMSEKIDVFSLGLIFHQILAGKLPDFDREQYQYPAESVMNGEPLVVDNEQPKDIQDLLRQMLDLEAEKRPGCWKILVRLTELYGPKHNSPGKEAVIRDNPFYRPGNLNHIHG